MSKKKKENWETSRYHESSINSTNGSHSQNPKGIESILKTKETKQVIYGIIHYTCLKILRNIHESLGKFLLAKIELLPS